jgi:hypothetical protein
MVLFALLFALFGLPQRPSNVASEARAAIAAGDLNRATDLVAGARARSGDTPDTIEALAVVANGALGANQLDRAIGGAQEARQLVVRALAGRQVDSDAHLAVALGTAIEVEAQTTAGRGDRAAALAFLER